LRLQTCAEYFLPYEEYPWFKEKSVSQISNVEEPSPGHYYWPDLDIDLSDSILRDPDSYPLRSKNTAAASVNPRQVLLSEALGEK